MKSKAIKLLALLALASLTATACGAVTLTFVDTITGSAMYQTGGQVIRGSEVGFESYPVSGNFTSLRPVFQVNSAGNESSDCNAGTSGAPIIPVGAWVAQPFTPSKGGNITSVSVIAQSTHTIALGYETDVASGSTNLTAFIVPADSAGNCTVTGVPAVTFNIPYGLNGSGVGAVVSSNNSASAAVTAGQKYYLVVGVGSASQSARLNWEAIGQNIDSSGATVTAVQQNFNNGSGQFFPVPGALLGLTLTGSPAVVYNASSIGDAKNQPAGTSVTVNNVVLTAKTGAVPANCFYVEDDDRASGIRVSWTGSIPPVGQYVNLAGSISTVSGEKVLTATSVIGPGTSPATPVEPMYSVLSGINGNGLSGIGLLMRVSGVVQNISPVVINDGSVNATVLNGPATSVGDMLVVTGIASVDASGNLEILVP